MMIDQVLKVHVQVFAKVRRRDSRDTLTAHGEGMSGM